MDLSKLPAAPWIASAGIVTNEADDSPRLADCTWGDVDDDATASIAEFIALARNAFDILLLRGWSVCRFKDGWIATIPLDQTSAEFRAICWGKQPSLVAEDPFTALVVGDKWYRENVDGQPVPETQR